MASFSAPTSLLTNLGKGVGFGPTLISTGVLAYEFYQFRQWQMDGGRFGYHAGSYVTSVGVGMFAGGPIGATVCFAASGGEMAYDVFKHSIMTINGQFQNLINIQR